MKKASIFIMDVVMAVLILIMGIVFLFQMPDRNPDNLFIARQMSDDIIGVLYNTQIDDLCINPGNFGCGCPNYDKLETIVCSYSLNDYDVSLLSMISELIETGAVQQQEVEDMIREIFVDKNVVDETRFGFSIIYSNMQDGIPLEIYNSDTYE